ncbi:hypothetical protein ABT104_30005 [Streptomyces mobaraensis]|uniref:hypothetical protein n=1 Tax=Streptomyces mobaraensis TaxID=35621 RepID=UPI00331D0A3F
MKHVRVPSVRRRAAWGATAALVVAHLLAVSLSPGAEAAAPERQKTFDASTSWKPPAGVSKATVYIWGAGGTGGGGGAGGGGGGGEAPVKNVFDPSAETDGRRGGDGGAGGAGGGGGAGSYLACHITLDASHTYQVTIAGGGSGGEGGLKGQGGAAGSGSSGQDGQNGRSGRPGNNGNEARRRTELFDTTKDVQVANVDEGPAGSRGLEGTGGEGGGKGGGKGHHGKAGAAGGVTRKSWPGRCPGGKVAESLQGGAGKHGTKQYFPGAGGEPAKTVGPGGAKLPQGIGAGGPGGRGGRGGASGSGAVLHHSAAEPGGNGGDGARGGSGGKGYMIVTW